MILLVKDRDATHVDPEKDRRGCYKRGDVVQVFPDGTPCVRPPAEPFWIVQVTGGPAFAEAAQYHQPQERVRAALPEFGRPRPDVECVRRRAYRLDVDRLPAPLRDTLLRDRYVEMPWGVARAALMHTETGRPA